MRKIDKPSESVSKVLEILKKETDRAAVLQDIESVESILVKNEELYEVKIRDITLYEIKQIQNVSERVGKDKMVSYYDYRLVQKPLGRDYYDKILQSAPYGICPYCNVRTVKTIDHFLPKALYPMYSVTPINLLPSCKDCNTDKQIAYPKSAEEQTFHPYFDDVEDVCWIKAELNIGEPLSFSFSVVKPTVWDEVQLQRAYSHFKDYNLNHYFSLEANRELRAMQRMLYKLRSNGRIALEEHLLESYESCLAGDGNLYWKTIMYKELSENDWFLDGCSGNEYFNNEF